MQWLDEAYMIGFLGVLAVGILLYVVTGAMYLYAMVAGSVNVLRIRRLEGPQTRDLGNTGTSIGDYEYQAGQSQVRAEIAEWGAWDAQRGVYVVEVPEPERKSYDPDPVRYYVWVKPPYVAAAIKAAPFTTVAAALLLSFALGSIMWGGLHFGFSAGGLSQAVWDKYHVTVDEDLPSDPGVGEVFEDVTVLVPRPSFEQQGYGEPVHGCRVDAGGGIENLVVACPDEYGEMHRLFPASNRPKEWFP
ncbi:MAG: hypothetical protein R2720_12385 [Candidatus Nanopelagicales bacterium]